MSTSSDRVLELISLVRDLQRSVDSIHLRLEAIESKLGIEDKDFWELVEGPVELPFPCPAPVVTSSVCPEIPQSLLSFAERLSSVEPGHTVRAKRAFEAGFRAKVSLDSGVWYYGASTKLHLQDTVWIVLKAPGVSLPHRVASKSDLNKLIAGPGKGDLIHQGFPSLTEAQIFCAGCGIAVPSLYRWRKQ